MSNDCKIEKKMSDFILNNDLAMTRASYLFDRSMIARLEGLFIRDLLANDISA